MAQTFADYFVNDLGWDRTDLPALGFYNTNSNGNGYGFLGFEDPSQSTGWLGKGGIIDAGLGIGQLVLGGLGAWNAMNQLDLARQQTRFARNAFNAQLNNSIVNYGNAIKNATNLGWALQGKYAKNAYGADSQEQAANKAYYNATKDLTRTV